MLTCRRTGPAHDAGCRGEPVQARPPCTSTSAATRPDTGSARPRRATAQGIAYTLGLRQRVQRRDSACLSAPSIRVRFRCDETRHRLGAFRAEPLLAVSPSASVPTMAGRAAWWPPRGGAARGGAAPPDESQTRQEPGCALASAASRGRRRRAFPPRHRLRQPVPARDPAPHWRYVADMTGPERAALAAKSIPLPCSTRGGPVSAAAVGRRSPAAGGTIIRPGRYGAATGSGWAVAQSAAGPGQARRRASGRWRGVCGNRAWRTSPAGSGVPASKRPPVTEGPRR